MTDVQASMIFYRDILIIMGLILFITNQVGALFKELSLDRTIRRARKLAIQRMQKKTGHLQVTDREPPAPTMEQAVETQAKLMTKWPEIHFHWWSACLLFVAFTILAMLIYIFFGYDPNPSN